MVLNFRILPMLDVSLKKISQWINLAQFKVGEFVFPFLEPVFRVRENLNPEVRKHFHQVLVNIQKNNMPGALLNLNMVLSLSPGHFLARVYRGRIYIQEGRYQLASEDYIRANQTSHYRFIHYDLYREYLKSVNRGIEVMGQTITQNFNQAFEVLRQAQEKLIQKSRKDDPPESMGELASLDREGEEEPVYDDDFILPEDDMSRFKKFGPITQKEIEETDWEKLIKQLSS